MSKIMIVTGGSRGIGAAVARLAGTRGYDVAVNYARARNHADKVVADIEAAGQRAVAVQADIGSERDLVRLFETVDKALGPVTTLVNNAGVDYETAIRDFTLDGLARVYAVNVFAPFIAAREAIKRMSTMEGGPGGTIINIGSIAAPSSQPAHRPRPRMSGRKGCNCRRSNSTRRASRARTSSACISRTSVGKICFMAT